MRVAISVFVVIVKNLFGQNAMIIDTTQAKIECQIKELVMQRDIKARQAFRDLVNGKLVRIPNEDPYDRSIIFGYPKDE